MKPTWPIREASLQRWQVFLSSFANKTWPHSPLELYLMAHPIRSGAAVLVRQPTPPPLIFFVNAKSERGNGRVKHLSPWCRRTFFSGLNAGRERRKIFHAGHGYDSRYLSYTKIIIT